MNPFWQYTFLIFPHFCTRRIPGAAHRLTVTHVEVSVAGNHRAIYFDDFAIYTAYVEVCRGLNLYMDVNQTP